MSRNISKTMDKFIAICSRYITVRSKHRPHDVALH